MRILVSGSSGFVGQALVSHFSRKGYATVSLLHGPWRTQDGSSLEDFDAVIHLAGEPITLGRWSKKKKEAILSSRSAATENLCNTLSLLHRPPPIFISASAVGYYGNRGEELLDEGSGGGHGFLADVCRSWEEASRSIDSRGSRTVHTRFGAVLGSNGGILKKVLPFYKLGLGATLSTGEQWVSWIELSDLILAIDHVLHTESLHGPVNLVAPEPVRQKEFCHALAHTLHRPALLHLPAWLLHTVLGTMADDCLLASERVRPRKLLESGFRFNCPDIESAFLLTVSHPIQ